MTKKHIMIDLESTGTDIDSCIICVALVKFTKNGIYNKKEIVFDLDQQIALNRKVNSLNLSWWTDNTKKAKQLNNYLSRKHKHSILSGLSLVNDFISKDDIVWAKGVTFDIGALMSLYKHTPLETPWLYSNLRCTRTLDELFGKSTLPFVGIPHNAMDDCINQVNFVIECLNKNV